MSISFLSLKRVEKGLTQKQLADECGVALTTIQRIESGSAEPRPETAFKIAKALDLQLHDILKLTNERSGSSERKEHAIEDLPHQQDLEYSFAERQLIGALRAADLDASALVAIVALQPNLLRVWVETMQKIQLPLQTEPTPQPSKKKA